MINIDKELQRVRFPHLLSDKPSFPQLKKMLSGFLPVRITELSEFWSDGAYDELFQKTTDLLVGLHGQNSKVISVLEGNGYELNYWFGVEKGVTNKRKLKSLVQAHFPMSKVNNEDLPKISYKQLNEAYQIFGVPSKKTSGKGLGQIESLCSYLSGSYWVYITIAEPVSEEVHLDIIEESNQLITNVGKYNLRGGTDDEYSQNAKTLLQLSQKKLKALEAGLSLGAWESKTWIIAEEDLVCRRAAKVFEGLLNSDSTSTTPVRSVECLLGSRSTKEASSTLISNELAVLLRPPVESYIGYAVREYAQFTMSSKLKVENGIEIGLQYSSGKETKVPFQINTDALTKHTMIVGTTGGGKTNTCFHILEQLNRKNINFLVIESAKSEYRQLLLDERFKKLRVYTLGNETVAPFRINPFEFSDHGSVTVQTHIDYLKALFSASFGLFQPLPVFLERSIQEVYIDCGWDLVRSINVRGSESNRRFPTISDLIAKIPEVVESIGYEERLTLDLTASLVGRISQLATGGGKGPMLDTHNSIDFEDLMNNSVVLELKAIASDEEKAFLIGLILIRLYEHYEVKPDESYEGQLKHLTLIEEAHRLLRRTSEESLSEEANPRGKALEIFVSMLAELRAYGEGLIISEQIPSKLAPDVIKNTNLKVVHRLVAEDDKELMAGSMNLSKEQLKFVSTLNSGVAATYSEGEYSPCLVKVPFVKGSSTKGIIKDDFLSDTVSLGYKVAGRFVSCDHCHRCGNSNLCLNLNFDTLNDDVVFAFKRLFLTFRFCNLDKCVGEFERFKTALLRNRFSESYTLCILTYLTNHHLNKLGAFFNWSFKKQEESFNKCIEVYKQLCPDSDKHKSASKMRGSLLNKADKSTSLMSFNLQQKDLDKFQKGLISLFRVDSGLPFVGCESCSHKCSLRFHSGRSKNHIHFKSVSESWVEFVRENSDEAWEQLVGRCQYVVFQGLENCDRIIVNSFALCFFIQFLNKETLAHNEIEEYVNAFKVYLDL